MMLSLAKMQLYITRLCIIISNELHKNFNGCVLIHVGILKMLPNHPALSLNLEVDDTLCCKEL